MKRLRWSPERVQQAVSLKESGLSASEVGKIMGVSRDAVLGQVWRASHPPKVRPKRKPPAMPTERIANGERSVWSPWGASEGELRKAIWAKAKRGAKRTRIAMREANASN
jgi:hypothetical protein